MYKPTGASLEGLACNHRTAQGGGAASLILADEVADWPANITDSMQSALFTSLGKQEGSRIGIIGVRPADDGNWFSRMLDNDATRRFRMSFSVPRSVPDDEVTRREHWIKANPSAVHWPVLDRAIVKDAADATEDPRKLAHFKARRANMGTSDVGRAHLLEAELWARAGQDPPDREGSPLWSCDLGQSRSGSACVAAWPRTGRAEAFQLFPKIPDLAQREK